MVARKGSLWHVTGRVKGGPPLTLTISVVVVGEYGIEDAGRQAQALCEAGGLILHEPPDYRGQTYLSPQITESAVVGLISPSAPSVL